MCISYHNRQRVKKQEFDEHKISELEDIMHDGGGNIAGKDFGAVAILQRVEGAKVITSHLCPIHGIIRDIMIDGYSSEQER